MVDSPIVVNTPIVPQIRAIQVTIVTCAAQTQTRLTPVRARNARKTADRDRIVRNAELCTKDTARIVKTIAFRASTEKTVRVSLKEIVRIVQTNRTTRTTSRLEI